MKLCLLRYIFGIFQIYSIFQKYEIMLVDVYFWNIPGYSMFRKKWNYACWGVLKPAILSTVISNIHTSWTLFLIAFKMAYAQRNGVLLYKPSKLSPRLPPEPPYRKKKPPRLPVMFPFFFFFEVTEPISCLFVGIPRLWSRKNGFTKKIGTAHRFFFCWDAQEVFFLFFLRTILRPLYFFLEAAIILKKKGKLPIHFFLFFHLTENVVPIWLLSHFFPGKK